MKVLLAIFLILGSRVALAEHSFGEWLDEVVTSGESVLTSFSPVPSRRGRGADETPAASEGGEAAGAGEGGEQTAEQKEAAEKEKKAEEEDKARFEKDPKDVTSDDEKNLNDRIVDLNKRLNDKENPPSTAEKEAIQAKLAGLETLRRSWSLPDTGSAVANAAPAAPPAPVVPAAVPVTESPPPPAAVTEQALSIFKPAPAPAPAPPPPAAPPPAPASFTPPPVLTRQSGQPSAPAPYLTGTRTTLSPISPRGPDAQATRSAPAPETIAAGGSEVLPILRSTASVPSQVSTMSPSLPAAPPAAPPPPASGRPLAPPPAPSFVAAPPAVQAVIQAAETESSSITSIIAAPPSSFSIGGERAVDLPMAPPPPAFAAAPIAVKEETGRGFAAESGDPVTASERPRAQIREQAAYGPAEPPAAEEVSAEPEKSRAIATEPEVEQSAGYNVPEGLDPELPAPKVKSPEKPVKISAKPKPTPGNDLTEMKSLLAQEEKQKQKTEAQLSDLTTFLNGP